MKAKWAKERNKPERKEWQRQNDAARVATPEKREKERQRWNAYDGRPERKARKKLLDHIRNTSEEGLLRIRNRGHKRRALIRNNGYEPYSITDIFKRDKYRCQICGETVAKKLKWPNPWSASVDHIVPIACGGADAPHNVQCAHLTCNRKKWARPLGQMRLEGFG